jgi:hypothetical protein
LSAIKWILREDNLIEIWETLTFAAPNQEHISSCTKSWVFMNMQWDGI